MSNPQEQFTELWHAEAPHVLAFASRHVGPEAAHDVVAETFMIAWRRWADLPTPPIAWLVVTARKVIPFREGVTRMTEDPRRSAATAKPQSQPVRFERCPSTVQIGPVPLGTGPVSCDVEARAYPSTHRVNR